MKLTSEKQRAVDAYLDILKNSWSWKKLNKDQQDRFIHYITLPDYLPNGNYNQVLRTISNYYQFYTMGIIV